MSAARIRLRYATLVNYLAVGYRMLVSVGFVVIVARRLSVSEFGLWGIMLSISLMLSAPVSIWCYWARRYYARGREDASGTGIWLTIMYLLPQAGAYLGLAYFENYVLGWGFTELLIALPVASFMAIDAYLTAFSVVIKPEIVGYKRVVYETLRLAVAYAAVVIFKLGYLGAVLSLVVALAVVITYNTLILIKYRAVNLRFSYSLTKEWLKSSYIPLLNIVNGSLRSAMRAIASWVTGSEVPAAYLNVALSAQTPLQASGAAAAPALYARMLREQKASDVEESIRLLFLTGAYTLAIFIVLSKPIASLYSLQYVVASTLIAITATYSIINALISVCTAALTGSEKVDIQGIKSHSKLIRSYLFKVPVVRLSATVAAYVAAISVAYSLRSDYFLTASAFLTAFLATAVGSLAVVYRMTAKRLNFRFPARDALAATASAGLMTVYYMLLKVNDITIAHFWSDVPELIVHLIVGSAIYVTSLAVMSKWFRNLVRSAFTAVGSRGFS